MSTLKVDYSAVENSIKYARKAAKEARDYAEKINNKVLSKIDNLTNGSSYNTQNAYDNAKDKMMLLNDKADRLELYAKKLENFIGLVNTTDCEIKKSFNNLFNKTFSNHKSIQIRKNSNLYINVELLDATEFGRWINDISNRSHDLSNTIKERLKYWYKYEAYNDMIKTKKNLQVLSLMTKDLIKASIKREVEMKARGTASVLNHLGTKFEFETPPIPYPVVGGQIKFGLSSTVKASKEGIVIGNNGVEVNSENLSLQINDDNQMIRTKSPMGQFKFDNECNIGYVTQHIGFKEYTIQGSTSIGKKGTSLGLISNSPYGSVESLEVYRFDKISFKSTIKTNPYKYNGIETSFDFEYFISPKKELEKYAITVATIINLLAGNGDLRLPVSRLIFNN